MSEKRALVRARGLRRTFRSRGFGRKVGDVVALNDVDIDIYQGEILALIGESGSGKTTLGKVLLRLMELDDGSITFDGQDLLALKPRALLSARRDFQMVFQNQAANLHPSMTVMQMMLESIKLHRPELAADRVEPLATRLLERVSLIGKENQNTLSLSGGEKRRVGLARILATQPKLIVADEPTSGLDAAIKLETIELLKNLKSEDMAYLVISHDLGLVQRIADRVLVMLNGQIVEELPAAVLSAGGATHPYTRQLLAASNLERMAPRRTRRNLGVDGVEGMQ